MTHTIYKLTCKETGKVYIGQTSRKLRERFLIHFNVARNSPNRSKIMEAMRTNPNPDNWTCEELCRTTKDEVAELESALIHTYNTLDDGLNSAIVPFSTKARQKAQKIINEHSAS